LDRKRSDFPCDTTLFAQGPWPDILQSNIQFELCPAYQQANGRTTGETITSPGDKVNLSGRRGPARLRGHWLSIVAEDRVEAGESDDNRVVLPHAHIIPACFTVEILAGKAEGVAGGTLRVFYFIVIEAAERFIGVSSFGIWGRGSINNKPYASQAIVQIPERLAELVPDYLEAVFKDPFDGADLRYRKLDGGFVVYSVGKDGVDDGGKGKLQSTAPARYDDVSFRIER